MVTRVDRKPVIYGTTLLRVVKPSARTSRRNVLKTILDKSVGYAIPRVSAKDLIEDLDDLELGWTMFGSSDTYTSFLTGDDTAQEDEAIRLARAIQTKDDSLRMRMKRENLDEVITKCQAKLIEDVDSIYCGMEAVYKLWYSAVVGAIFAQTERYKNHEWCMESACKILSLQAPYHFIHPIATDTYGVEYKQGTSQCMHKSWELYKKMETLALRLSSRKNVLAHSHHLGMGKRIFEVSQDILSDFELPLTGFTKALPGVTLHLMAGIRYFKVQRTLFCLSHDDSVSLSMLAQCYAKTAFYFNPLNGYKDGTDSQAVGVLIGMYAHIVKLIESKKLFSNFIRALHILAQKEFNDCYELDRGTDLGWEGRSKNYTDEAVALDPACMLHYGRTLALASSEVDKLNVNFLYHALLGDEMTAADLKAKVIDQVKKVRPADATEWAKFIKFCKSYFLSKYMSTNKCKPKVGGKVDLLNSSWANKCVSGIFTMPPITDWGEVYIEGAFPWAKYADLWHLECQDVALVVKDEKGIVKGKYSRDAVYNSELLYALKHGDTLDHLTNSTPQSARDRIVKGIPSHVVMLTCAPKAENAKPTWKKRITFSADNEFRKMQAEVDRNTRKCMAFMRGPSLGVSQTLLESQFKDICQATALGAAGAVSSHDISAWSESLDRARKFEFEKILVQMSSNPQMSNIERDWDGIKCAVTKQGMRESHEIKNSTFQGFDGSECTILHAVILYYCIDSAKRAGIIPKTVKADMADLIDDCVAVLIDLCKKSECMAFWAHLKSMYNKLGFEIDDLKSIYSTIKAIYLGRRFLLGGEVPSDFKVFIKAHISYEDPLRCMTDYVSDIYGGMRNACEANGDPWFTYLSATHFTLLELAHDCPEIMQIPYDIVPVLALAPQAENGWAFPSIITWGTNDITDKRVHYNCIVEMAARQYLGEDDFLRGSNPLSIAAVNVYMSMKEQPWRKVGMSGIFNDPMGACRDGPMHADNLRKHAVADCLKDLAVAEPWVSLLNWDSSNTTEMVREQLAESGILHAPTLQALVNCMPDAYKQSMLGKAVGSSSVLDSIRRHSRYVLKRRVLSAAKEYFKHGLSLMRAVGNHYTHEDVCCLSPLERSVMERTEFYTLNGVEMTDHTFPDPVAMFTRASEKTDSYMCPNIKKVSVWDQKTDGVKRPREWVCTKGIFVPPESKRVWEVSNEYGRGWDQVSRRIATGLAVLARASTDGHDVSGLHLYFIKSWNEMSNITPEDTQLIAIQGSIKRLDSNPGSSVHQITFARNISLAMDVHFGTALNVIPSMCNKLNGSTSHLHDMLSHNVCMRAVCTLIFYLLADLRAVSWDLRYEIACKPDMIMPSSVKKMTTGSACNMIEIIINDSATNYGLLQASRALSGIILVPTTQYGWASMINCLVEGNYHGADALVQAANALGNDELEMEWTERYKEYSSRVVKASTPIVRGSLKPVMRDIYAVGMGPSSSRAKGDTYATGIKHHSVKVARELADDHPEHVAAAVVLKSMVWERLKHKSISQLAGVYYNDPDSDYTILLDCKADKFWVPIVREISKHRKKKHISELVVFGCRVLGVTAIELKISNDIQEIGHAVASFFGAHLNLIAKLCGDAITSVAGRSEQDYSKPVFLRSITHNPGAVDNAKRKEHLKQIIDYNVGVLNKRLSDLKRGNITHRGDKRVATEDRVDRMIELRCRRFVYQVSRVKDNCKIVQDCEAFCRKIVKSGRHALMRAGVSKEVAEVEIFMEEFPDDFSDCMEVMEQIGEVVKEYNGYWNTAAGLLGVKTAITWLNNDCQRALDTKFAITPAELIPKTYRLKNTGPKKNIDPDPLPEIIDNDAVIGPVLKADDEDELIEIFSHGFSANLTINIEFWKALFTLALIGSYDIDKVCAFAGKPVPTCTNCKDILELELDHFSNADIKAAFPLVESDYALCGTLFKEEWLSVAEAEGYTVDDRNI